MNEEILELLPALRRFAWSLTNSVHDADDLLQATVERLLVKGVPNRAALKPWAYTVCRNLWVDEYRSRKVRQTVDVDPELSEHGQFDGEKQLQVELELDRINQAMRSLPPEQHEVLTMVSVQGFAYREVADELGIPIGTVMSRLARARSKLANILNMSGEKEISGAG